jgi:hypothetical protein
MDVSGVSSSAVSMLTNTASTNEATSIYALKKALEMQENLALQLIESVELCLPKPDANGSLGVNIDVYA